MLKLFTSLYFAVFASIVLFFYLLSNVEPLGRYFSSDGSIEEIVSIGTFSLLNQSIEGLNKQQRKPVIEKYKTIFGSEFGLIDITSKHFSSDQIATLNNSKVLIREEEVMLQATPDSAEKIPSDEPIIYFKVPNSTLVWRTLLSIEISQDITSKKGISTMVTSGPFAEGIFYLIEEKLKEQSQASWPIIIKDLEKIHNFSLSIKAISSLNNIGSNQKISIQEGKIINTSQGSHFTTFVHRVFDSSMVIQLGPVEIPWYLRNYLFISLVLFLISFATMLLLWIWPFWSSLTKLRQASDHFGNGDYETRISYTFLSPITKINKAFNAMAEHTQRSIDTQKELTSAISHELRTPVARMRFALEMLNESGDKTNNKRFINDINTDIDELDMLLEELLTYARLDHDKADNRQKKLGSVRLSQWFKQTMQRLKPLANTKNLSYTIQGISENETALIEPRLMSRVLDNLVQNAIRYADQTIKVTLTKEPLDEKDNTNKDFLIIVEDDGEGIPEEKQEHSFDAFSRIDESRDRASGGFGLGLAIANRIVINHQGTIRLHQSNFGGACFVVRIPLKT